MSLDVCGRLQRVSSQTAVDERFEIVTLLDVKKKTLDPSLLETQ